MPHIAGHPPPIGLIGSEQALQGGFTGALSALNRGARVLPMVAAGQADMVPTNHMPNPYTTIEGWARLHEGRSWGSTSSVDLDPDGVSIWVGERCGANIGACTDNPDVDPIMKFDPSGTMVISFGAGLIAGNAFN